MDDPESAHLLASPSGDGIHLHSVTKSFGSTAVLHGIDLHLEKGSIYGITITLVDIWQFCLSESFARLSQVCLAHPAVEKRLF